MASVDVCPQKFDLGQPPLVYHVQQQHVVVKLLYKLEDHHNKESEDIKQTLLILT